MDERILVFLGIIWAILNRCYINSCRQEDIKLERALIKLSQSSKLETDIPVSSMSRNTRTIIGYSIASFGLFISLLLIRRARNLAARQTTPTENPNNELGNQHNFFNANDAGNRDLPPEDNNSTTEPEAPRHSFNR
jgi:hypothetical protein